MTTEAMAAVPAVHDSQTAYAMEEWMGHRSSCNALAVNSTDTMLVSGGGDHVVRVWSHDRRKPLCELSGHESFVTSVIIMANRVLSASHDSTVRVWDLSTTSTIDRCISFSSAHKDCVTAMAAKGQTVVTCGLDACVALHDLRLSRAPVMFDYRGFGAVCTSIDLCNVRDEIAVGSTDNSVRVLDLRFLHRRAVISHFSGHERMVSAVRFMDGAHASNCVASSAAELLVGACLDYIPAERSGPMLVSGDYSGHLYAWPISASTAGQAVTVPAMKVLAHGKSKRVSSLQATQDGCVLSTGPHGEIDLRVPCRADLGFRTWQADCQPCVTAVQTRDVMYTAHGDGVIRRWRYESCVPRKAVVLEERKRAFEQDLAESGLLADSPTKSPQRIRNRSPPQPSPPRIPQVTAPRVRVSRTARSDDASITSSPSNGFTRATPARARGTATESNATVSLRGAGSLPSPFPGWPYREPRRVIPLAMDHEDRPVDRVSPR